MANLDAMWDRITVTMCAGAAAVPGAAAYAALFDRNEDRPHLTDAEVEITQTSNSEWTIEHHASGWKWQVDARLVLCEAQMLTVATLLYDSKIPSGKTVQLQADAHIAGSYTWIGMIASYDDVAIPFATVSADIGCGLSILPVCQPIPGQPPKHLCASDVRDMDQFRNVFMLVARKSLYRGKKSDTGDASFTIALFDQALAFLGNQIDLPRFKRRLASTLATLRLHNGDEGGDSALLFASRFLQSLGSSGNHFIELAQSSDDGSLYVVTHSGSRGLGATVYSEISAMARVYSGSNVATGPLCDLYRQSFDILCTFAQVNRILCAMACMHAMRLCIDGSELQAVMCRSRMFANSTLTDLQKTKLLFGLTHNGIKTFANHRTRQVIHVLSKGAVALSRRADIGIVALRAGEGCDVFVLNDPAAEWVEVAEAGADYEQIFDLSQTDLCFAGHGAGRSGSATSTHKRSTYEDMITYYDAVGFIGNLTPGVLGDNPAIAYKSPAEIRQKLPLDQAVYTATLKTLVNHKEGMDFRHGKQFAQYCVASYADLAPEKQLWLDLGLVRGEAGVMPLFTDQCAKIDTYLEQSNATGLLRDASPVELNMDVSDWGGVEE